MDRTRRALFAVIRLELAEVLRSRWLLFCVAVYGILALVFVLVGLKESTVQGFTGTSRVLLSLSHALLVLLPLMALTATGQVVNHARDDGTLELLFSQPIGRGAYLAGVTLVRYAALVLPLGLLMFGVGLYGWIAYREAISAGFLARCLAVSATLLWAFAGLGVLVSTVVRNQAKAMIYLLLLWVGGVALLDFALSGLMLQWQVEPRLVFTLAALNPVQAARMALLSAVDPELSVLGPVGFYLANQVGATALLLLGLVWPLLVGWGAFGAALWRFRRGDVV
ncbi:MAG: ABC transporter permease [Deltaproteobacteria bacterium]|nr:ABC transporter permease [Deltaproteobacteria bacterium]